MHLYTIALVVGIVIGIQFGYESAYASSIFAVIFSLSILEMIIYLFQRKSEPNRFAFSLCISLISLGLSLGIIRVQSVEEKGAIVCEESCSFKAEVVSPPKIQGAYQSYSVAPKVGKNIFYVLVRSPLYPEVARGDVLTLTGKVTKPDIIYPHDGERSFDYGSFLESRSIGSTMLYPHLQKNADEKRSEWIALYRIKDEMMDRASLHMDAPESTVATGMLFGNDAMPKSLIETFRLTGLSHIVVLSGFNIAILIAFTLAVLSFLPFHVRLITAGTVVVLFVIMVGGETSVIRAMLMSFVALFARMLGREYVAKQALMLSLIAIVLFSPDSLMHDVSLHLSFIATAGIIYLSPVIASVVQRFTGSLFFTEILSTTVSAYVATLPYVLYAFGLFSTFAIIANSIVVPLVPIIMAITFLTVLASYLVPFMATITGFVASQLTSVIISVAELISSLPFSGFRVSISFTTMLFAYAVLITFLLIVITRKKNETQETSQEEYLTGTISF